MENAETILVIFLSTFLALFLLLAVIATVKLIQVLNNVKSISEKADAIATKAEAATDYMANATASKLIGAFFNSVVDGYSKRKSK